MNARQRLSIAFTVLCVIFFASSVNAESDGVVQEDAQKSKQKWRILVVAESENLGLIAGHPAYKRVNAAISSQLQQAGFQVLSLAVDEGLPRCLIDVCKGKTQKEIVGLAKASPAKIDLLILYSIRYVERVGAALVQREISVPSRMIDVQSGRKVGQWDDDAVITKPIPASCVEDCLQNKLSDFARQIGQDSGLVIALKLQDYKRSYDYHLSLVEFSRGELFAIEQFFKGQIKNKNFRDISEGSARRVLLHYVANKKMIVETVIPPSDFRQLIEQALDAENISARVRVDNRNILLTREGFPYIQRYVVACAALLASLLLLYRRYVVYKHKVVERQMLAVGKELKSISRNNPYGVLMKTEYLLDKTQGSKNMRKQHNELLKKRNTCIENLPILVGPTRIEGAKITTTFVVDDTVLIGRSSHEVNAGDEGEQGRCPVVSIGYKRLSNVGKQNRIQRQGSCIVISDEGSTNGSWLDERPMVVGEPITLMKNDHILSLGGSKHPPEEGVCQLNLKVLKGRVSSLIVGINGIPAALSDQSYIRNNWPNLTYDQRQQWVLLGSGVDIGVGNDGSLDIGCCNGSTALLTLSYRTGESCAGYWVTPIAGEKVEVLMNGVLITVSSPLVVGGEISLGGISFILDGSNIITAS